jgi:hypothetical protein
MDKKGEMKKVAGIFDLYGLRETAKTIRDLSNDLYEKCKMVDFEKAHEQIQEILRTEFISGNGTDPSFRKNMHLALIRLANSATKVNSVMVKKQVQDSDVSMRGSAIAMAL